MTLAQLRHFVTLAEWGSYVAASRRLFLTQPALSRSIQGLEAELGQALFDRVGRRIELTAFGRESLVKAQRLVRDADALKQAGRAAVTGQEGSVRIGLSSGPGAMLSVPLMLHMAEHHPRLHLGISRGSTDVLLQGVRTRSLDVAVVDIRAMRPSSDLNVTHQVEMAASFLCRAQHPLLKLGRPVTLQEILDYPVASTPLSDEVARMMTERYGPLANPDDMVTLRCDDTTSLVSVAERCDAIVLTINGAGRDLVRLQVTPTMTATARFGLVTLGGRSDVPALHIVTEVMQRVLRD